MQEKTPPEKKPEWPETGKEGGQGDGGKKGGDVRQPGEDLGKPGDHGKERKPAI